MAGDDADAAKKAKKLGMDESLLATCRDAFRVADVDNSGHVNTKELRDLLDRVLPEKMSDEEYENEVHTFDDNHDGFIDFHEFLTILAQTKAYYSADNLEAVIIAMGKETRKDLQRVTPLQKLKAEGVPIVSVMKYVRTEIAQMDACLQLPVAIMILVTFGASLLLHENIGVLHSVDESITMDIEENANFAFGGNVPFENGRMGHKNIFDVNTFADFWSWFSMGLIPLFWVDTWELNEVRSNVMAKCGGMKDKLVEFGWPANVLHGVPNSENPSFGEHCPEGMNESFSFPESWYGSPKTPTYKNFFAVVGGMRLRQERTETIACPAADTPYHSKIHTGFCVPESDYWLKPEVRQSVFSREELMDLPGGETKFLFSGITAQGAREFIRGLENEAWMNPYTAKVDLLITLYNPQIDTFTAVYVVFFINKAGNFWRMVQPVTFWLHPFHGFQNYVADCLWLLLVLKLAVGQVESMIKLCKKLGVWKGLVEYATLAAFADWMNVVYTILIGCMFYAHIQRLEVLMGLLEQASVVEPGSFKDDATRISFFDQVEAVVQGGEMRRVIVAAYPFVLVARFFKAFSAQPRLSLVTSTISSAAVDLFHFLLVFLSIFGLFTMSAIILFGQDLQEFVNIPRAADSAFHILLGDFDWEVMRDVGRLPSIMWFWSFMCLVNLVMLNMLLAIVMDVYTEVRGSIGSRAETLWSQTREINRRRRELRAGRRVSLQHVIECMEDRYGWQDKYDSGNISMAVFMDVVTGMPEHQCQRILLESATQVQEEADKAQRDVSSAAKMLGSLDSRLSAMSTSLGTLMHMVELHASHTAKNNPSSVSDNGETPTSPACQIFDEKNSSLPGNKAEEKMQSSVPMEEPPAWFKSFADLTLQSLGRMEKLETSVGELTETARSNERKLDSLLQGLRMSANRNDPRAGLAAAGPGTGCSTWGCRTVERNDAPPGIFTPLEWYPTNAQRPSQASTPGVTVTPAVQQQPVFSVTPA